MVLKAQKVPSWIGGEGGGGNKGPWGQQVHFLFVHLRPAQASIELKYSIG